MKKLKGFTLIELLIVIIIIGILATIAIVAYSSQTAKANKAAFTQNVDQAVTAAALCTTNGDKLVNYAGVAPAGGNVCQTVATTAVTWPTAAQLTSWGYTLTITATDTALTALTGAATGSALAVTCGVTGCS